MHIGGCNFSDAPLIRHLTPKFHPVLTPLPSAAHATRSLQPTHCIKTNGFLQKLAFSTQKPESSDLFSSTYPTLFMFKRRKNGWEEIAYLTPKFLPKSFRFSAQISLYSFGIYPKPESITKSY